MSTISNISQLNEVIQTSQSILKSPVAAAIRFAGSMKHLLNAVYRHQIEPVNPLEIAGAIVQHVKTDALSNAYIRYSKVKVTWGALQPAVRVTAVSQQGGIQFTWNNNSGEGNAGASDRSIMIAYCKAWNRFRFNPFGAERQAGSDKLELPDLRGQYVHTWLGFISADGKEVSDSVYSGRILVV